MAEKDRSHLRLYRGGLHPKGKEHIPPSEEERLPQPQFDYDGTYHNAWLTLRSEDPGDFAALLQRQFCLSGEELATSYNLPSIRLPGANPPFMLHDSELAIIADIADISRKDFSLDLNTLEETHTSLDDLFGRTNINPNSPFGIALRSRYVTAGNEDVNPNIFLTTHQQNG